MAEFKLDRFTYTFQGVWSPTTAYRLDDIVVSGGRVYYCTTAHTSSDNFFTDYLYDYTYPAPYTAANNTDAEFTLVTVLPDGVANNPGSNLEFTVTRSGNRYTVAIKEPGIAYIPKIAFTITGSQLGGVNGVNDARVTIETVDPDGAVLQLSITGDPQLTKWELMSEGYRWRGNWQQSEGVDTFGLVAATRANPVVITTNAPHNFTKGQEIVVTGVNGMTQLNGNTYYVNPLGANTLQLYSNSDVTVTVDGTTFTQYISSGSVRTPFVPSEYILNDLVNRGGQVYRCIQGHIALKDVAFGFERNAQYWTTHTRGARWRGDWTAETSYIVGDLVRYNGVLYRCKFEHDSADIALGLEAAGLGFWDVVDKTDDWADYWQVDTRYREKDIVRYGGYVYRCVTGHTSAPGEVFVSQQEPGGLEQDLSNWSVVLEGVQFRSVYSAGTRYYLGDLVKHGQSVYRCTQTHTAASAFNEQLFEEYIPGIGFDNTWTSGLTYQPGDIVVHGGYSYRALKFSTDIEPPTDALSWALMGEWYNLRGNWTIATDYKIGDMVRNNGYLYLATADHTSGAIDGPDVSSSSQTFKVDVRVFNGANKYYINDTLTDSLTFERGATYVFNQSDRSNNTHPLYLSKLLDGILGGGVPYEDEGVNVTYVLDSKIVPTLAAYVAGFDNAISRFVQYQIPNDAPDTLYYACYNHAGMSLGSQQGSIAVQGSTNWQILMTGKYFVGPWVQENDDSTVRYYELGDIVTWAGTAYQCIKRHAAITPNSRPEQDLKKALPEYWSYYMRGIKTNVLAEIGDIKSYWQGSNERIVHGDLGTALKVLPKSAEDSGNYNFPTWALLGRSPKVYYVSTSGVDALDKGGTEANPFRTVKYACDYILADESARAPATIVIATGEYREELPISIPADVALVGHELRSTRIMPAEGYETSNMFYVRNGCGIRNMTLEGLTGGLSAVNEYGTSRPTGGAFVSLDPGTGPDDQTVWIINKSTYVQNVTTIGTGCVGLKIDGNLHDGGNKSVVANDFTQVLSDGIGVWCTNLGLTELVSVFTYYCHIGYLSEIGGKIRATNGNNSYGDYGSVAEGYDLSETPITAVVDNRTKEAQVGRVYTDQDDEILLFGYTHAGENYSLASVKSFSGTGSGLVTEFVEFRDGAIKEVRLMDPGDSSTAGGFGFEVVQGLGQRGDTTSLTLSLTDTQEDSTSGYNGKLLRIIAGAGVGQYGIIDTYDPSTKIAVVRKISNGQPGWDHLISGTPIEPVIDDTAYYQIQPLVEFSKPPFSKSTANLPVPIDWSGCAYGNGKFVAIAESEFGNTTTGTYATSIDGVTWIQGTFPNFPPNVPTGSWSWRDIAYGNGKFVAVADEGIVASSSNGTDWLVRELAEDSTFIQSRKIAYGDGYFVVMSTNGDVWWQSTDGINWQEYEAPGVVLGGGITVRGIAYGQGHFIVITSDFDSTANRIWYKSPSSTTWNENFTTTNISSIDDLIFGNNRFVAVQPGTSNVFYNVRNGKDTWVEVTGALPSPGNWKIGYGQGVFIAVRQNSTEVCTSEDAITWTATTTTAARNWSHICFGNPNYDGKFLLLSAGNPKQSSGSNIVEIIKQGKTAFAFIEVSNNRVGSFTILDPGSGYTGAETSLYVTKTITVERDAGNTQNVFFIDGSERPHLDLVRGITYKFDLNDSSLTDFPQDDSTTTAHPFFFADSTEGIGDGGNYYENGLIYYINGEVVTRTNFINNFAGANDRYIELEVQFNAPTTFYYYSSSATGMGNATSVTDSGNVVMTITDPQSVSQPKWNIRLADGVLPQPSFISRGTRFRSATATITGDGYADLFQLGSGLNVQALSRLPGPGDNLDIAGIDGLTYKVTSVENVAGNTGSLTAKINISPKLGIAESPAHATAISIRQRYSQVRLTFHDFLDIGTGNFGESAYPQRYIEGFVEGADNSPKPFNEVQQSDGGRVFYASTDQDGNFRVGELFEVEQARGTVTLNADQFELQGLTELSLGGVTLGGTGAVISEFSIDPLFTANSDRIVPTQKAIAAYVANRITGGGTSINVNGLVAGVIQINFQTITMTTLEEDPTRAINVLTKLTAQGGVGGQVAAMAFFASGTDFPQPDDMGGTDETGGAG